MADELVELQREWRTSVMASIKSGDTKMDLILEQLTSLRMESVNRTQMVDINLQLTRKLEEMAARVSALEADRAKLIGAAVVLNFVGGVVIYLITKLWK